MQPTYFYFEQAKPTWKRGDSRKMNQALDFVAYLSKAAIREETVTLSMTAACSYVLFVNGAFVAYGPARAAHGLYKVDRMDLSPYLTKEENTIAVRVTGYNMNSFCFPDQPSFFCAEVHVGDAVAAHTPDNGFCCYEFDAKIQRVQRYSYQRVFAESYRLNAHSFDAELGIGGTPVEVEETEEKHFLKRDVPYLEYPAAKPQRTRYCGRVSLSEKEHYYNKIEITGPDPKFGYKLFPTETLECASHIEYEKLDFSDKQPISLPVDVIDIPENTYIDLENERNHTGLFSFTVTAKARGRLMVAFDEIAPDGELNALRNGTSNFLTLFLEEGCYRFTSCEPYTMKHIRLISTDADLTVEDFKLIRICFPASHIRMRYAGKDPQLQEIFDAAVETFAANTVDIYMDCPSRERAGWLCDSFFTSRVEKVLSGKSVVEKAFLQSFLYPEQFYNLPAGMLPMCYPADHYVPSFIPNWAMWYLLELEEYLGRTGDRALIDAAKERMYALLSYLRGFENEYGLLEQLEGWIFVEWSEANKLVQDVSFCSNMLYAAFKRTLARLYGDEALTREAEAIKKNILELSMTPSGFFCDNAYRKDGKLVLSGERTETCQYYAFFFDVASPETHPQLLKTMIEDFGYDRKITGKYPEIHPSNAFIGNYLRLELLLRFGYREELYNNIKGYFSYMAETTGTLWEFVGTSASCNHGFASHVIYWMQALGLLEEC